MMINNCSISSNPLPGNEDFISPPLVHPMSSFLFEAAMKGDTNYLQTLQDLSNLHLKRTICNKTVLHVAAEFDRMEFARLSIQFCPPLLSLVNSSGDTALHVAAREGRTHMVELFLSYNDSSLTRLVNSENDTALHCCAKGGETGCVELLVQADPEVCGFLNKAHESPLYLLIVSRNRDVFTTTKCIIDYAGSSASHKGSNGLTALHAALLYEETMEIEEIVKKSTQNESVIAAYKLYGEVISKLPKKWGRERITEQLVEWRREMIREGDNLGMTPLHYAAFHGKIKPIRLFLQYNSNAIYCLNNDGQSALHVAAFRGKTEVLEELVKCRPDCYNMVDNKGRTALHAAVLGDQHEVVELILKIPSLARLINKVDKDGNSPLHLAAYLNSYEIIESLRCKEAKLCLNHNFYIPYDVYGDTQLWDMEPVEHREFFQNVKDYSKIMIAGYHLVLGRGVVAKHEYAKEELKRMNPQLVTNSLRNKQLINKSAAKEKKIDGDGSDESSLEVNLLVAMLVATVTFAAGFTVPGGLVNDGADEGLATLTNKPAFQAFVVFNTLAFFCSIYAVLVHFITSLLNHRFRVYYKWIATSFTAVAIVAMVLAFCFGTYVVLTKSTALSLIPYCILASFLPLYPVSRALNALIKLRPLEGEANGNDYILVRAQLFADVTSRVQNNK